MKLGSVQNSLAQPGVSRRGFLVATGVAGGGLIVASIGASAQPGDDTLLASEELNAFIQVSKDAHRLNSPGNCV